MRTRNTLWVALFCLVSFGACDACASKTPVPFKRGGNNVVDAGAPKPQRPVEAPAESSVYPDGTQKISANDTVIERPGTIRASWSHDVDGDGQPDLLLITTDQNSRAMLEVVKHGASDASTRLPLDPYATASPCRAIAGSVTALGKEQAIASVDFLCDAAEPNAPEKTATPVAATPQPTAAEPSLDLPPEPSATLAQTHQYVIGLGERPRVLLHLAVEPSSETGLPALRLNLSGDDLDGDDHADVKVDVELATSADADAKPIALSLTWLNRPTGLARERDQPEHAIAELGEQALRLCESKPDESLALADKAIRLHRALCRESGLARLWVD
ncbi:MAG TPA: hypothetical protein VHZ95_16325, partial [Polyangiales bacterium]|nr:hypothetical protein [Polyangiales bacterium]